MATWAVTWALHGDLILKQEALTLLEVERSLEAVSSIGHRFEGKSSKLKPKMAEGRKQKWCGN